jgi:hypothetical protein
MKPYNSVIIFLYFTFTWYDYYSNKNKLKRKVNNMKTWMNAELHELEINQTEHKWTGSDWDGFFVGRYTPTPTPNPEEELS